MKANYLFTLIFALILISCKNDDDSSMSSSPSTLTASDISIVFQDGSSINQGECIDPEDNYAVKITVLQDGDGAIEPTIINYTLNGNTSSTTFTNPEPKIINITLLVGENNVQLQDSGISDSIFVVSNQEFEIVL